MADIWIRLEVDDDARDTAMEIVDRFLDDGALQDAINEEFVDDDDDPDEPGQVVQSAMANYTPESLGYGEDLASELLAEAEEAASRRKYGEAQHRYRSAWTIAFHVVGVRWMTPAIWRGWWEGINGEPWVIHIGPEEMYDQAKEG